MKEWSFSCIAALIIRYGAMGVVCTVLASWFIATIHTEELHVHPANAWVFRVFDPFVSPGGKSGYWVSEAGNGWFLSREDDPLFPGVFRLQISPTLITKSMLWEQVIERGDDIQHYLASEPPSWSMASKAPTDEFTERFLWNGGEEQVTGFPFLAMYGANFYKQDGKGPSSQFWSIELPMNYRNGWMVTPRILPLKPIWPGFVLNVVFYALLAAAIRMAWWVSMTRRRIRKNIRNGKCRVLRCGYLVEGQSVCPECGTEQGG